MAFIFTEAHGSTYRGAQSSSPLSPVAEKNFGGFSLYCSIKHLDSATGLLKFAHDRRANELGVASRRVFFAGLDVWIRGCLYHTIDTDSFVVVMRVVVVVGGLLSMTSPVQTFKSGTGHRIKDEPESKQKSSRRDRRNT